VLGICGAAPRSPLLGVKKQTWDSYIKRAGQQVCASL